MRSGGGTARPVRSAITGFLIAGGAVLFVLGWVGAATGAIVIPFDQHHILSQLVGLGMLMVGLSRLR